MKYIKLFEDFEGDNGLDITNLSSLIKSKSFKVAGDIYLSHVESLGYLSSFLQDFAETLTEVSKNLGINQDDIEAEDDYQGSRSYRKLSGSHRVRETYEEVCHLPCMTRIII